MSTHKGARLLHDVCEGDELFALLLSPLTCSFLLIHLYKIIRNADYSDMPQILLNYLESLSYRNLVIQKSNTRKPNANYHVRGNVKQAAIVITT